MKCILYYILLGVFTQYNLYIISLNIISLNIRIFTKYIYITLNIISLNIGVFTQYNLYILF